MGLEPEATEFELQYFTSSNFLAKFRAYPKQIGKSFIVRGASGRCLARVHGALPSKPL